MSRTALITRRTGETDVEVSLTLDGNGAGTRATGVGFFDHMLELLARHGRMDLDVAATGDLETGPHHTVEDTGIVLGQALHAALGDRSGITRYGTAVVPMDEARATAAVDLSGRAHASLPPELGELRVGEFSGQDAEEFFRSLARQAGLTLHLTLEAGSNDHHMIEACFKALARALRQATAIDPTESGVPSTKGRL